MARLLEILALKCSGSCCYECLRTSSNQPVGEQVSMIRDLIEGRCCWTSSRAAADSILSIQSDGVTSSLPCLTNRHHNSEQLTYLWPAPPGTTTHLHHLPTPLLNPPPPPSHVFRHPHPLHCTLTSQVLTSIFCLNKSCLGGWEMALRKDQTNTAQWHARTDRREKKTQQNTGQASGCEVISHTTRSNCRSLL